MKKVIPVLLRLFRCSLMGFGAIFLSMVLFAFTTGPYWMYHWLGTSVSEYRFRPDYIIIMGGAGYPSESALMRSWYAAKLSELHPGAKVIVTQPAAVCVHPQLSDAWGIRNDLVLRGVDSSLISVEIEGRNTREEALKVIAMAPDAPVKNCVLVTAPEHMRRSILTFRKAGFLHLGGVPTFNASGPVDLDYKDGELGGRYNELPDVGGSLQIRYQFWNHLRYQVICYRELFGLAWYRVKGWI
jgi:uncharacterized SAM-binding protein YcdF (DUF218 family)